MSMVMSYVDFMPPDMVGPLAESNASDIIVLAIRMGMQWRALEPEIGKMQADGNGYSLTSTDVRGLGTVLRFTSAGTHGQFPRIVPSRAADKMLFGIVPGDPILVRKDLPLITKDGKITDISRVSELLNLSTLACKAPRDTSAEVFNDTVTLILPFLPLGGSTITSYCFPGWRIEPFLKGIHWYCESRLAFLRRLQSRWTTHYFVEKGLHEVHIDDTSKYLHLVAGNALMAVHAIEFTDEFVKNYPHRRKHDDQRDAYNITSRHGYFFGLRQYEMGQRYVHYMAHPDFGVAANLRERGLMPDADEVEVAWWILQLRCIIWGISTWHPNDVVEKILGTPVQSSL
ncbi:hypothetical protein BU23DRAFT_570869 [Bimuria novae-zelandiae CBS 107.79]|uniref:Uncharacterized protein n=1 Tax=Bimuria novae-zelandiae CBS 107.79 TaxID=1447943 RepID=A0A6A5V208_9PLEO|nr:hypothetical protein BU23DRAFT_570869 [Bimuria novae-zelandiae CBS 107.79]